MPIAPVNAIVDHLRRAVLRDGTGLSDAELLEAFLARKEEESFAALVERHGPMVLGVCRRVTRNHHDAEDAFQATFLVLARKASSVKPREMVGNWLHGVAYRIALKARAMATKRKTREQQVTEMPEPQVVSPEPGRDPQPLLDQELNGLPEIYRLPILLCDLEGKTIKEAMRQLGWPQGTVAGRLARGRKLLAKRLANRGVVLSAGSLASVVSREMASAGVPPSLMVSTVKAAMLIAAGGSAVVGVVPVKVAALMDGVMKAMLITKLKTALLVVMSVTVLAAGTGGMLFQSQAGEPQDRLTPPPVEVIPASNTVPMAEKNPLPPGEVPSSPLRAPTREALPEPSPRSSDTRPTDPLVSNLPHGTSPTPTSVDELRRRYAKLQEELSHHLTAPQMKQRVDELERELAAAKLREQNAAREKAAAAEMEKVQAMLTKIASTYPDTASGAKARQLLGTLSSHPTRPSGSPGANPFTPSPTRPSGSPGANPFSFDPAPTPNRLPSKPDSSALPTPNIPANRERGMPTAPSSNVVPSRPGSSALPLSPNDLAPSKLESAPPVPRATPPVPSSPGSSLFPPDLDTSFPSPPSSDPIPDTDLLPPKWDSNLPKK